MATIIVLFDERASDVRAQMIEIYTIVGIDRQVIRSAYQSWQSMKKLPHINLLIRAEPIPPSLHQIAKRLGYAQESPLRTKYPELCAKVVARRKEFRTDIMDALRASLAIATATTPHLLTNAAPEPPKAIEQRQPANAQLSLVPEPKRKASRRAA